MVRCNQSPSYAGSGEEVGEAGGQRRRRAGNEDRFWTEKRESKDLRLINNVFNLMFLSETSVKTSKQFLLFITD